ncbi:ribosome maturation protein [Mycotypha africana]|uniref:ribosome maturation protein n=1 Tax=Mycotypha africana TaxID=64632 RepID=UPI002300A019|nr:ribosome maturation protein [Mycotypha africana]KAI8977611.1 ribosome maturation protein [Mycotypha africana]
MPSDQAVKVVYKGNDNNEYFVIANPGMVSKWKKDKSIPMVDVVQNFNIHTTSNGSTTGEAINPASGALKTVFNTTNEDEIVKKILCEGHEKGF